MPAWPDAVPKVDRHQPAKIRHLATLVSGPISNDWLFCSVSIGRCDQSGYRGDKLCRSIWLLH